MLRKRKSHPFCSKCEVGISNFSAHYGSGLCASCVKKGKPHNEEHKRKIKESTKGKINLGNKHTLGVIPWNKNKTYSWSQETTNKYREFCRIHKTGSNSSQWKGGLSLLRDSIRISPKYNDWRLFVYQKNQYICVNCGSKKDIEAHHKKEFQIILNEFLSLYKQYSVLDDREFLLHKTLDYSEFWEIGNGETLCRPCHNQTKSINRKREKGKFICL